MEELLQKIKEVCICTGVVNLDCPCQPYREELMDLTFGSSVEKPLSNKSNIM